MPSAKNKDLALQKYERTIKNLKVISTAALILGIIAILTSFAILILALPQIYNSTQPQTTTAQSGPGSTLAGIDQPLNATQLAVINNAPNAYFQRAGTMYLNGSIPNTVAIPTNKIQRLVSGNKTAVVYYGSITCIFCGENRWAMALALSRFGNFTQLYQGYSAIHDGDVPTLYWTQLNYNKSGDAIGDWYSSRYVSFLAIEDINPITGGFTLNPAAKVQANINSQGNQTYISTLSYLFNLFTSNATSFKGTPYTVWGDYQWSGADAVDFGNSTQNSTTASGTPVLSYMTHAQVIKQIANPSDGFGWTEYAAADMYTAALCKTLNNTAPVCSLSAIQQIELQLNKT